ncbi:MAG: tetratricopeptide repeat protein [Deltaproteobacteria bacterium]|nr:MAG: tetratricopeptide repeat protein [Deltaproteobacteria bacterium]
MSTDPYRDFRQAVDQPEEKIDLGRAALTIALTDYPNLDVLDYLARIDRLAVEVTSHLDSDADIYRSMAALNYVLFKQHAFHGNRDDYFDPKNSFLNEVIERKTGIPITLSVLYMEVGRRAGLRLDGVGFPGHFLVKSVGNGEEIAIDPFNGGEIKSREDIDTMLFKLHGGKVKFHSDFLASSTKKDILKRMLANLKAIYINGNDLVKSLSVLDRLLILDPASAEDARDRGVVYLRLECYAQAREDFETYLRLRPNAEDAMLVREQLVRLAKEGTRIH